MDKLGKVIQAFENCTDPEMIDDDETYVDCIRAGECPWDDCQERGRKLIDIPLSLAMAALELLKEQGAELELLRKVKSGKVKKHVSHDVVLINGDFYREHPPLCATTERERQRYKERR